MKSSEMKKATKRILAMLLCTSMVLSSGVSASADEGMAAAQEQGHVHTEACYEKQNTGNLICTKAEVMEGHVHGDECYETTPKLTCEQEEHSHDDGCYTTETRDVCNDESEEHTCGDACVETEEVLTCTAEEHSHDDGCYETETNLICGQEEVEAHIHNDECYAWEEKLVCTLSETAPMAEEAAAQETVTEQPKEDKKAEEAVEAEEVNLQNDDETGIKVSVKSTSDVIPEDTKVVVASMEMDEEHEAALAEAVSEFEVLGYTAYDISLKDAEDEDITLGENKVEVVIDFEELIPEGINAEEVKDVVLVHITTDEEEKLTAETVGTVKITEEKATVEFEAESFSPYVVTYLGESEEAMEEVVVEESVVEDVVLTYTSEDETYTATVTAAPEALENVTAFEAVPVTDEEKITALTEQLTAKAAEAQKTSLGFENYEFKFLDAEGNEAVVEGKVKVSLSFAEARLPEAATAENVDAVDAALLETAEEGLEEINGLISAEAGAVKEVVYTTEAPEELILAWSGDVYRTLPNYEDDDVVITLAGTEYALQNVVGFNVTPIKEEVEETKEQYAEVAKQLEEKIAEENEAKEEEKAVVGFLAYDITLVDAEGNELEPQGGVRVSMEYKEAAAPEAVAEAEEAEVTIHHFEEDEKGEVKQIVDMVAEETIEAGVTTTEKAEVEKAEFVTEGFSVFTITWIKKDGTTELFKLTKNIQVLVVNGTNYSPMVSEDGKILANLTVSSDGTPPTLFADSIAVGEKNEPLYNVKANEKNYQFVKIIHARKDRNGIIQAVHLEPVVAIQAAKNEDGNVYLRYMLDGTGTYKNVSELPINEFLAFVYMDGNSTAVGSYYSEDGKRLSDITYDFSWLVKDERNNTDDGIPVVTDCPIDAIAKFNDYEYRYIAIEQLGKRVIPTYLRYHTETINGVETSKLQYRMADSNTGERADWVDVVDADIRLIYKTLDTITTANTAGVVDIDLFNYNIPSKDGGNPGGHISGLFFGTGWESGDNRVYNLWTGGVKERDEKGNVIKENDKELLYNNMAVQGIVKDKLENGYPVASELIDNGGSLASLFDHSNTTAAGYGKSAYVGLNHLFKIDEKGYYVYDSGENYAYFNREPGNKNFTIYNDQITKVMPSKEEQESMTPEELDAAKERGDFMPFVPATGENGTVSNKFNNELAYHMGMTIGFDFIQPEGGRINGQEMIFKFSGDDDVWVFVDGQLVLDIGGLHNEASGEINFTSGDVVVETGPKVYGHNSKYDSGVPMVIEIPENKKQESAKPVPSNTTLKDIFTLSGDTFEENSSHRLEFFYLERGADVTNCAITFNLQPVKADDIEVEKKIVNTDKAKYGDVEFTYQLYLENEVGSGKDDGTGYDLIPEGTKYTLKRDGEVVGTRTVEEKGIFKLKHGESAVFEGINESLKYYVKELSVSNEEFSSVRVNGSAAQYFDESGNEVTVTQEEGGGLPSNYIAQSAKVTVKEVHKVLFQNTCAETNKNKLRIEKKLADDSIPLGSDEEFTFRVMLENRAGVMVPYVGSYKLESKTYKEDGTVGEPTMAPMDAKEADNGLITIKVDQAVIIEDLMAGTDFYVDEINLDPKFQQRPDKVVVNADKSEKKFKFDEDEEQLYAVDGTIPSKNTSSLASVTTITITNALRYNWEIIKISSSKDDKGKDVPLVGATFSLSNAKNTYTGRSGAGGKITWNLEAGEQIAEGTYTLKETIAPTGYSLNLKEWEVVISKTSVSIKEKSKDAEGNVIYGDELVEVKKDNDGKIVYDADGIACYTVKIENEPLYELPSTGGHGIYTTMLSGFALMLGAAYVWFTSRRKEMLQ